MSRRLDKKYVNKRQISTLRLSHFEKRKSFEISHIQKQRFQRNSGRSLRERSTKVDVGNPFIYQKSYN